jgi:hypothetical protein
MSPFHSLDKSALSHILGLGRRSSGGDVTYLNVHRR